MSTPSPASSDSTPLRTAVEPSSRRSGRFISLASPLALLALWRSWHAPDWSTRGSFPRRRGFSDLHRLDRIRRTPGEYLASLLRLFWGSLIGGIPRLPGLAMGLYRPVRAVFEPLVAATYPVPKSASCP